MMADELTVDEFTSNNVVELRGSLGNKAADVKGPITGGGGGSGMSEGERISRLETHFEYIRKDLDELKSDQKKVLEAVMDLPTRSDLWSWKLQWAAICVATIALIVGGIIGGLSWIKSEAAPSPLPQSQSTAQPQSE